MIFLVYLASAIVTIIMIVKLFQVASYVKRMASPIKSPQHYGVIAKMEAAIGNKQAAIENYRRAIYCIEQVMRDTMDYNNKKLKSYLDALNKRIESLQEN